MAKREEKNVTTNEVRLNYIKFFDKDFTPEELEDEDIRGSVQIMIPKSDVETKKLIEESVDAARAEQPTWFKGNKKGKVTAIHDGDGVRPENGEPYPEFCKGHWLLNLKTGKTNKTPKMFSMYSMNKKPIELTQDEVYNGMWAIVKLHSYPYDYKGTKGVSFNIDALQKRRDDEKLSSGYDASQDFDFEESDFDI